MKTKKLFIAFCAVALAISLASCGQKEVVLEKDGETTVITNNKKSPEEVDAKSGVYIIAGNLQNSESYQLNITGNVLAEKGFIKQTQSLTNNIYIDGDACFNETISDAIISSWHQAYYKDGKVAYRNALSGDYTVVSHDNYKSVFGVIPSEPNLFGFVYNNQTIVKADVKKGVNEYTFNYSLDPVTATTLIARQTKEVGGLNGYPTYSSVDVSIKVDSNWNPISAKTKAAYKISLPVLGSFSCVQDLSYSFSNLNKDVTIPNLEALNKAIGSDQTQVDPSDVVKDEYGEVFDALTQLPLSTGVSVNGYVNASISSIDLCLPVELDITSGENPTNLDNVALRLKTSIMGLDLELNYRANDNLYISVGDNKMAFSPSPETLSGEKGITDINIKDVFSVKKSDDDFDLTFNVDFINSYIKDYGITLNECNLHLNMEENRPTSIDLELMTDVISLEGKLFFEAKEFEAPTLDGYQQLEMQSLSNMIRFALPLVKYIAKNSINDLHLDLEATLYLQGQPIPIPITLDFKLNNIFNGLFDKNIFDLNVRIDISDQSLMDLLKMIMPMLGVDDKGDPIDIEFISKFADCHYVDIKLNNLVELKLVGLKEDETVVSTDIIPISIIPENFDLSSIISSIDDIVKCFGPDAKFDFLNLIAPLYGDLMDGIKAKLGDYAFFIAGFFPDKFESADIRYISDESGNYYFVRLTGYLTGETKLYDVITIKITANNK